MEIRTFSTTDQEYQASLELRNKYLRIPLGLDIRNEDLSDEVNQTHFGLFEGRRLLASVILKDLGNGLVKLRQMVVDEKVRGKGLGRKLIQGMEKLAKRKGVKNIEMSARFTVKGFYEKSGYRAEGGIFEEVGISHIKMKKRI